MISFMNATSVRRMASGPQMPKLSIMPRKMMIEAVNDMYGV